MGEGSASEKRVVLVWFDILKAKFYLLLFSTTFCRLFHPCPDLVFFCFPQISSHDIYLGCMNNARSFMHDYIISP